MTDTQGAHAQPEALRGAPPSAYSQEDRAFYTFWYGHMLNEWMQPPLAGVSHSTARYIWDAAIAHAAAPAHAADSVLEDAARYRFLAGHCRSTSEHWGGRWSIVVDGPAPKSHDSEDDFDVAVDAARAAHEGKSHDQ